MSETASILVCTVCMRQFEAGPEGLVLLGHKVFRVDGPCVCGRADCALVKGLNDNEEARRAQRRREKRVAGCRVKVAGSVPAVRPGYRLPYPDDPREAGHQLGPDVTRFEPSLAQPAVDLTRSILRPDSAVPSRDTATMQSDFVASGAADSADELLWNFFMVCRHGRWQPRPEQFQLLHKSTFLEEMVMKKHSSRMNNRAITFRERCQPLGLDLDNRSCRPHPDAPRASCYILLPIEDSLRLGAVEKERLLKIFTGGVAATDGHR